MEAALEGMRLRRRPLFMTSIAFILGCAPLWIASRVLVRGEPARVAFGRADDFTWPRHPVQPLGTAPIVATSTTPLTPMVPYETRQASAAPAAAPAQRIGPPPPGPAQTRQIGRAAG